MIWPFADPPNVAVFTSADVVNRGMPIVYVAHDDEDGAWQFHSANGAPSDRGEVRIVGLKTILALDPSIAAVSDLKFGWCARRKDPTDEWRCERCGR